MARIIEPDGGIRDTHQAVTLEFMQETVGGYIEIVRTGLPDCPYTHIVLNEEGKLKGLAYNPIASMYYNNPFDEIVGTVILCQEGELD